MRGATGARGDRLAAARARLAHLLEAPSLPRADFTPITRRLARFSGAVGAVVSVVSLLVLVGWARNEPALTRLYPTWPGMTGTVALGFLLAGLSLWLQAYEGITRWARRGAHLLAVTVIVLGALTLIESLYGTGLGAARLIYPRSGGIAPSEAINFVFCGAALVLLDTETRSGRRPTEFFALMVTAIVLPILVGFLFGTLPDLDTEISGLSSIAFVLLAAGLLFARPRAGVMAVVTGQSIGGVAARRLLPLLIGLPLVLGAVVLVAAARGVFGDEWTAPLFASSVTATFAAIGIGTAISFHRSDAERRRAEMRLLAQHQATRALIESRTVTEAIPRILSSFADSLGWDVGVLWRIDRQEHVLRCTDIWHRPTLDIASFEARLLELAFAPGVGTAGQVWMTGEPAWVPDLPRFPGFLRPQAERHGLHAGFAFPLRHNAEITGVIEFFSREIRDLDADLVAMASVLGSQVGAAIERKRSEEQLRASEDRFRAVAESASDALVSVDSTGLIAYLNPAAEQMFQLSATELGEPIARFLPQLDLGGLVRARTRALETVARRADGRTFPVEGSLATWASSEGGQYVTAMLRDITARKRSDAALRKARDDAEAMNRELEAYTYSVSHDLQAPVRRIEDFSEALLEEAGEKLDDASRDKVLRVRAASQAMTRLIDDLLELSRANRAELQAERVDLSGLARAVASDLQARQPARKVDVEIQSGVVGSGDPGLLRRVLENLLGNAWKFTGKSADPRIEFGAQEEKGATVYFVRDNGVGFDPAYVHLLFTPFRRLHRESDFPGTGVGLAVVQRIVHRHGGRVWAEGAVDRGATFSFTLPGSAPANGAA